MKIAVVGIGGVGGIVGGALARKHRDTFFYVRGENLNKIRKEGLKVESVVLGDFTANPKLASDDADEIGRMDAVIVTCKGYSLESICKAIVPVVGPETLVLPLLNGVVVSDIMESMLPPCLLADGTIQVFSRLEGPGHIIQSAGMCRIAAGMKDGSRPDKLIELVDILKQAGVKALLSENILVDSWTKYAYMCGCSVVFCHYDGPASKVRENPGYEQVLHAVVGEIIAVAAAKGVTLADNLADVFVDEIRKMPPDTMTSLYRDISSGKPADQTELYHIIGRMVEHGEQTGVATPYHREAYDKFR